MRRTQHSWIAYLGIGFLWLVGGLGAASAQDRPFADVASTGIAVEARYAGADNFVGKRIDGYLAPKAMLSSPALAALERAQQSLALLGLGLKVFDGYRPQRAVDHFVRWASDLADTQQKAIFYPNVDKANLFSDGYIAERSGHSRGSTVDLTVIDLATGEELDMGTPWDFFDLRSWPASDKPNAQQRANRALLRSTMLAQNFRPLETEWWHFTLNDEPFPDTYFDAPVE